MREGCGQGVNSADRVATLGVGVLPDHSTLIYCPPPSKLENMAGSDQAPEAFPAASGAVHDPHAIPVSLIPEVRLTHLNVPLVSWVSCGGDVEQQHGGYMSHSGIQSRVTSWCSHSS